jgi:AcrR family transcriptional regulator
MSTIAQPRMTPAAARLLETASTLFYRHGLTAVGVERIADEAGTTKKTLYDRFGSKDGLITAYLRGRRDRWHAHVLVTLDAAHPAPGKGRVLAMIDALESWMADNDRGCGFVNAHAELAGTEHPGLAVIAEEKAWTRRHYVDQLTAMDVPEAVRRGHELAMVHEGAVVQATAGAQPEALAEARTLMERLVDDGIAARC